MHFGLMLMFAKVTGHFVPKSFRTQAIKYLLGHFVPTRTNYPFRTHVISLLLWSINSNLVTKCQKWLRLCRPLVLKSCHTSLVISYLYFAYFVPIYI